MVVFNCIQCVCTYRVWFRAWVHSQYLCFFPVALQWRVMSDRWCAGSTSLSIIGLRSSDGQLFKLLFLSSRQILPFVVFFFVSMSALLFSFCFSFFFGFCTVVRYQLCGFRPSFPHKQGHSMFWFSSLSEFGKAPAFLLKKIWPFVFWHRMKFINSKWSIMRIYIQTQWTHLIFT